MEPKEKVYNFISEQLTLGKLKRSDRLTEQYLVDNLGISRTPVREALIQLSADEILEREPRKGFRIKTYTKKDVEDLYELIGVLDGKIAQMEIDVLTPDDYALMNFLIDSMYSAIDNELYTKYNSLQEQFHNVYLDKCSNSIIKNELITKKKIFIGKAYSRIDKNIIQELLRHTNDEHKQILQYFEEKNTTELRSFLENVHWNIKNAKYDIW
ncbi:GntR family transcriptional regulator [Companilactobacillus jidongensis]|uniref:GntR family transcriptional regulator n=1 Tax=Companilactobacillus jidongensis TaxID=2486006 RepID=UPI000F782364|nr:GntR family transcriptional regulator [Companilactobacillus jidongensis]